MTIILPRTHYRQVLTTNLCSYVRDGERGQYERDNIDLAALELFEVDTKTYLV